MSNHERPTWQRLGRSQDENPEYDAEELRLLEEHLAELREQGVLVKGEGIRGSLRQVAYIPGALESFLAQRNEGR